MTHYFTDRHFWKVLVFLAVCTASNIAAIGVSIHGYLYDHDAARAFRCGERMEAIITAQADHTPLTARERACWAEWQGEGR